MDVPEISLKRSARRGERFQMHMLGTPPPSVDKQCGQFPRENPKQCVAWKYQPAHLLSLCSNPRPLAVALVSACVAANKECSGFAVAAPRGRRLADPTSFTPGGTRCLRRKRQSPRYRHGPQVTVMLRFGQRLAVTRESLSVSLRLQQAAHNPYPRHKRSNGDHSPICGEVHPSLLTAFASYSVLHPSALRNHGPISRVAVGRKCTD